MVEFEWNE